MTLRGLIKEITFIDGIPEMKVDENLPPPLQLGIITSSTQIRIEYENEENPVIPEKETSSATHSLDQYVGGLDAAKAALTDVIQSSLFSYNEFKQFHVDPPRGVLLYCIFFFVN